MKISIIGASAGIGLETVKRSLTLKHDVTTLSRSEIQLPANDSLKTIQGSATKKADLTKAIEGADAVIVALGTGKNMKATTLFSDFAKVLVEVQQANKMDIPFLFVTGFGTGESQNYVGWFVKLFLKYFLKDVTRMLAEKGWTIENVDCTLTLEHPKVNPHILEMKSVLAPLMNIEEDDISIKATTAEKLGYVGREEGVNAYAVALIRKD